MASAFDCTLPESLAAAENLPSLPGVALELLELAKSEDAGLDDYARVISSDPALAVRILKLSNSSLFSLGQEVTTLERAAMVLGTKTVQLMSLSFSLVGQMTENSDASRFPYTEFWRRSLTTAVAGRELGRLMGFTLADESFLCGLLTRIGQPVLFECVPTEYERVLAATTGLPTREAERALLSFDHTDIGAALLKEWGLPEPLYMTVAFAHDPTQLPENTRPETRKLSEIVHLACQISDVLCGENRGPSLERLYAGAEAHGLSADQTHTLVLALEARIRETAAMLDLDVTSELSHYEILDEARKELVAVSLKMAGEEAEVERRSAAIDRERGAVPSADRKDELTGLGDREFFDAVLAREIKGRLHGAGAQQPAVLLVELADAGELEDRYGERVAEEAIHLAAQAVRGSCRDSDVPARFGNAAFAVIVPEANPEGLAIFAQRLNDAVARSSVATGRGLVALGSATGVGTLAEVRAQVDGERLVELAEAALAKARTRGAGAYELETR